MSPFAEALPLACELGWPIFPVIHRTKHPLVGALKADGSPWRREYDNLDTRVVLGGFHRASTLSATVCGWACEFDPANVGLRLGGAHRITVLEADSDEALAFLHAQSFPVSPVAIARRGPHRYFAAPADIPERPSRFLFPELFGKGLELKTGAGYVLLPPSVHPSGHIYQWARGRSPFECELATLPATFADEARRLDAERLRIPSAPASAGPLHATVERSARVARYLAKVDTGLSDGRRMKAYQLAAALSTRLDCTAEETRAIVFAWNACNNPALPDKVLESQIRDALLYGAQSAA